MSYQCSWYPMELDDSLEGISWVSQDLDIALTQVQSKIDAYDGLSAGSVREPSGVYHHIGGS